MKRLAPTFTQVLGTLFVLGVAALVTYLSYNALGRVFPDDWYYQILGLVVFDVAAMVWFFRIVSDSETKLQYVWSTFGFLAGFAGVVYMVRIETQLNAGVIVADGAVMAQLADVFISASIVQFALTYAYKMSDKETTKRLHTGLFKAEIFEDAIRQAGISVDKSTAVLGSMLHGGIMRELLRDLHVSGSDSQLQELFGEDVIVSEKEENTGVWEQLKDALFGKKEEAQEEEKTEEKEEEEKEEIPNESDGTK